MEHTTQSQQTFDPQLLAHWRLLLHEQWTHLPTLKSRYDSIPIADMPSHQLASPEEMKAHGWCLDYRRDERGRLAV